MKVLDKIKKFWNETLGPDYEEAPELNMNSNDPVEAALAKSSKKIDEKVQNYGKTSKAKREQMLKDVKVEKNELEKASKAKSNTKSKAKQVEDKERED